LTRGRRTFVVNVTRWSMRVQNGFSRPRPLPLPMVDVRARRAQR
jgi:hypothetical protein